MTTATETTRYAVHARGNEISTHKTEAAAVAEAQSLPESDCPSVVLIVTSGTYKSRTQVWPTQGETYSN